MKAVRATLVGGLGNQMFIAAAAAALAERLGSPLELDHAEFRTDPAGRRLALDVFPTLAGLATSVQLPQLLPAAIRRRLDRYRSDVFVEAGFSYDARIESLTKPVRMRGYFQAHQYFDGIDVRELFALTQPNPRLAAIEAAVGSHWIGMHVRRGDYLNASTAAYHGLCSDEYFLRGLHLIRPHHDHELPVVLFTDQPDAVSARLNDAADFIVGPDPTAHEAVDLWAMSHASALVMSNSSFSWWAAYLGESATRPVVAPRPWFQAINVDTKDLLLPNWLQIGISDGAS